MKGRREARQKRSLYVTQENKPPRLNSSGLINTMKPVSTVQFSSVIVLHIGWGLTVRAGSTGTKATSTATAATLHFPSHPTVRECFPSRTT